MSDNRARRVTCTALRAAAAALLILAPAGCGDDDDDGNNPAFTRQDAVETASGAALTSITSMHTLLDGMPGVGFTGGFGGGFGAGKNSGPVSPLSLAWDIARARITASGKSDPADRLAPLIGCPEGGAVDTSCVSDATTSVGAIIFTSCRAMVDDEEVTLDGTLSVTVADPNFCAEGGELPDGVQATLAYSDFTATARAGEVVTANFAADLSITVTNSGDGCDGEEGSLLLDGTLDAVSQADNVDFHLTAEDLSITVASGGAPCVRSLVLDGSLDVVDAAGGRSLSESFDGLVMTATALPNGRVAFTIDGTADVSCLGDVVYDTVEPVIFVFGSRCPAAGVIEVSLTDGTEARFTYTALGGVTFDLGADGTVEASFASCHHEDLAECASKD